MLDHVSTSELHVIEQQLGHPAYKAPGVLLYKGDCIELMRCLSAPCIDLTVTSPPYNIGKEYERPLDLSRYVEWCAEWIAGVFRLTKMNGTFWLNLGYLSIPGKAKAIPIPYLLWDRVPFYLVQEIVWNYGAGVAARTSFSPRNEKFLWYVRDSNRYTFNLDDVRDPEVKYPNQKKNGKLKCNPLGKNPSDVWQVPKVTSGTDRSSKERTDHPAQFPTALVDRIVRASSNAGEMVLDPFMGSGSTAIAALRAGRRVVGFELEERYVELAARRIDAFLESAREEVSQPSLL